MWNVYDSIVRPSLQVKKALSKLGKLQLRSRDQGHGDWMLTIRVDIMKATSEQMELGYKKLHRWCQFEFRQFTKEAQLEVSPLLRDALQKLKQRPALLE